MRRGGQARLGHKDHSILAAFTSHLEAVSSRPLILIEAPSSAYHGGMLRVGNITL
jgi:hypothetical protein